MANDSAPDSMVAVREASNTDETAKNPSTFGFFNKNPVICSPKF
jgi:hypothetical protein